MQAPTQPSRPLMTGDTLSTVTGPVGGPYGINSIESLLYSEDKALRQLADERRQVQSKMNNFEPSSALVNSGASVVGKAIRLLSILTGNLDRAVTSFTRLNRSFAERVDQLGAETGLADHILIYQRYLHGKDDLSHKPVESIQDGCLRQLIEQHDLEISSNRVFRSSFTGPYPSLALLELITNPDRPDVEGWLTDFENRTKGSMLHDIFLRRLPKLFDPEGIDLADAHSHMGESFHGGLRSTQEPLEELFALEADELLTGMKRHYGPGEQTQPGEETDAVQRTQLKDFISKCIGESENIFVSNGDVVHDTWLAATMATALPVHIVQDEQMTG